MADKPLDLTVEIAPKARFDLVDLRQTFAAEHGALAAFPQCLYWSCHTTAGFLDRSLATRLRAQHIPSYLEALRTIFPEGAGYEHDRLEARSDLDPDQRAVEPRNADSHLAFMAGGLRTCVTHPNQPDEHVYFVDLDGINDGRPRRRLTRLIGFNAERQVASTRIEVPMSAHAVDSINLKDPELGVYAQLLDFVRRSGVERGRLRVALDPAERHSGLTVNEYETLLMRHDLAEVLANPFRFVGREVPARAGQPAGGARQDPGLRQVRPGAGDERGPRPPGAARVGGRAAARPHGGGARGAVLPDATVGQPAGGRRRLGGSRRSSRAPTRAPSWCSGETPHAPRASWT